MGRFNKTTEGVFAEMVGTDKTISNYEKFLNNGKTLKVIGKDLQKFTKEYENVISENKTTFERLAKLEEIIMQMRSADNNDNIKLSLVREYIYARSPFFRLGRKSKDVRVIVGTTDIYGEVVDKLLKNQEFMDKAKEKLKDAMNTEVEENVTQYKKIFQKNLEYSK